jgi:hypothetical protein
MKFSMTGQEKSDLLIPTNRGGAEKLYKKKRMTNLPSKEKHTQFTYNEMI